MNFTDEKKLEELKTKEKSGYLDDKDWDNLTPLGKAIVSTHSKISIWTGTEYEWEEYEKLRAEQRDDDIKAHARALVWFHILNK